MLDLSGLADQKAAWKVLEADTSPQRIPRQKGQYVGVDITYDGTTVTEAQASAEAQRLDMLASHYLGFTATSEGSSPYEAQAGLGTVQIGSLQLLEFDRIALAKRCRRFSTVD